MRRLNLADQILQVEGFREDLGALRRAVVGVQRHRGEAGDEHDLEIGIASAALRGSSMPSISGMTMSVRRRWNGSVHCHDDKSKANGKALCATSGAGSRMN